MPKLESQDENYFNLIKDNGEKVSIAKKGLSPSRAEYFAGLQAPSSLNRDSVLKEMGQEEMVSTPAPQEPIQQEEVNLNNFEIEQKPQEREPSNMAPTQPEESDISKISNQYNAQSDQVMGEYNKQVDSISNEYDERREEYEIKLKESERAVEEISEDFNKNSKLDPQRYWSNMSTGRKILAGIGLALAAVNPQSMQTALRSIQNAWDKDIESQKLDIQKKQGQLKDAKGLVATYYKRFNNLQAAESAARVTAMQNVKLRLMEVQQKASNALAVSKAETAVKQIEAEMLKEQTKLRENLVNAGGYSGIVENKTEAKEFRGMVADLQTAKDGIDELLQINEKTFKSFSPSLRAKADTIQKTLIGLLRQPITGPGAMSDGEREMLKDMIANPTNLFSLDSSNRTRLKKLQDILTRAVKNKAQGLGLKSTSDQLGFREA